MVIHVTDQHCFSTYDYVVVAERGLHMEGELGRGSLERELAELRKKQTQVVRALQLLFDLLEKYAPSWYTEGHHKQALAALECGRG
jgi:hypothetical protein